MKRLTWRSSTTWHSPWDLDRTPTTDEIDTHVIFNLNDGKRIQFLVNGFAVNAYGTKTFDSYAIGTFLDNVSRL